MKNALKYYYNIEVNDIRQMNNQYTFIVDNTTYYLIVTYISEDKLQEIYKFHISLLNNSFPCHQIILNNNDQIITIINKEPYILLKINTINKKITIDDLIVFNQIGLQITNSKLKSEDWNKLWMEKIDYFEYQVNQLGKKFPLIRESMSYYIGLTETAIELISTAKKDSETPIVISHHRIKKSNTLIDLYNPLSFVFDYRVRDIAEYYKSKLEVSENVIEEIKQYIYNSNLSTYECSLLLARFIYPTNYFDIYEQIINGDLEEKSLNTVINRVNIYEKNIKELYQYLKSFHQINNIEWLN